MLCSNRKPEVAPEFHLERSYTSEREIRIYVVSNAYSYVKVALTSHVKDKVPAPVPNMFRFASALLPLSVGLKTQLPASFLHIYRR